MQLFTRLKHLNHSHRYLHVIDRLEQYAYLIRLDRPIGAYLLLWPTLWALWIAARGWPDMLVLFVFVTGVFLMRSAGCAINDFADRDIDPHVDRTKDRPLAAGRITTKEALLVFATLSISAFLLVLMMNSLTIYLSFGGILLAASYPFMKRFHYMPQVHLGAAFGWAVPMAFTAQANEITAVTWLLFMATVLWATAYDTMYAMADKADDIKIGVKSTAILFGDADKIIIGLLQLLLMLDLILIGQQSELGLFYYMGLVLATGFAVYQQYLIKDRKPQLCVKAFINNNWFGLVIFTGIFIDYWVS
jgi:4-hydroxybenzoate polyprenyltransferase